MVSNMQYIRSTPGVLKTISITLSTFVAALALVGHFTSNYTTNREEYRHEFTGNELRSMWREYYLMGVSVIFWVVSIINLLIHLFSRDFYWDKRTAIYDFLYHAISAIILATAGGLFIVSAVKIYDINCTTKNKCQHFEVKLGAGALSLMNAAANAAVGVVVLTNRKDVERDALIDEK